MAELPGGPFDPSKYKDMQDWSPVPPGKYVTKIIDSEVKDTSTGGQMLVLNFDIVAGAFTGKGFVTRLNLWNSNPKAVQIAGDEMQTITKAILGSNVQVANSDVLHGIACVTTVKLVPGDGKYGPSNQATFYESAAGLTTPPVNPEPDEHTLSIMDGTITSGNAEATAPSGAGAPPPPPAGAGASVNSPPPPTAAVEEVPDPVAPPTVPSAPPAPPAATPPAAEPAPAGGKPPW